MLLCSSSGFCEFWSCDCQVRSVWPVRFTVRHRCRPTNRTQNTMVIPWPGSDRAGALPRLSLHRCLPSPMENPRVGVAEREIRDRAAKSLVEIADLEVRLSRLATWIGSRPACLN